MKKRGKNEKKNYEIGYMIYGHSDVLARNYAKGLCRFFPSEGIALYPMDRHSDLDKIQKFLKSKMSCASCGQLSS
mgnify:CR=1 FL=1